MPGRWNVDHRRGLARLEAAGDKIATSHTGEITKIIIAGAGIGGMALAALLRQRGVAAELYERAPNFDHSGYMLGLFPVGTRVLHGLHLVEDFLATGERMATYTVSKGHGQAIHSYEIGEMLDYFGYTGGIIAASCWGSYVSAVPTCHCISEHR